MVPQLRVSPLRAAVASGVKAILGWEMEYKVQANRGDGHRAQTPFGKVPALDATSLGTQTRMSPKG